MVEVNPDSAAVKRRLITLYESSRPQLFTQLLGDYDPERRKLNTKSTRIYDLRAAARVQILFADGFKAEAAIMFLQEAIRHIETFGLPSSDAPAFYPDGREVSPRADAEQPARAVGRQAAPAPVLAYSDDESAAISALPPDSPAPPAWVACRPGEEPETARASLMSIIPALFSSLQGPRGFTLLNLETEPGAEQHSVVDDLRVRRRPARRAAAKEARAVP